MKKYTMLFTLLLFVSISIEAQTKEEKKELKEAAAQKDYESMKALIDSGTFSFEAQWATSQKGRRINLTTNANFLKVDNGEADIYLPYFGVAHSGSVGFGGEGGIVFKGTVENYNIEINDKKQRITIKFDGKGKTDKFNFTLTVNRSGNSNLFVSSNYRSSINYSGEVSELKKKE